MLEHLLLLLLLKPRMVLIGGNVLAGEVGLGLAVELHGIQRLMLMLMLLELGVWLLLRLLRTLHGRGVDVLERHLRWRLHIPIHGRHVGAIVALEVLRLLLRVMGALVCLRLLLGVVPLVLLVDLGAHCVRSVGILHPRGSGLGLVSVHLMVRSLGRRLLAVVGRPRRHGALVGHCSGRMRGVWPGSGRGADAVGMLSPAMRESSYAGETRWLDTRRWVSGRSLMLSAMDGA